MANCRSKQIEDPEEWRDVQGFAGLYQVSNLGQIRRVWPKSGKTTILKPYIHRNGRSANNRSMRIHLTGLDGRRIERSMLTLVAETFLGVPEGKYPVHKNGQCADNRAKNIVFMTPQESGRKFGVSSQRKPVVKITLAGEIVDCYSSAVEAAKENYLSYEAVTDRCNGRIKKEYAIDGCTYRWDK